MRLRHKLVALGLAGIASAIVAPTPVAAATAYTIWNTAAVPLAADNDTSPVELGVRFRSDISGFITAIRFYKYAGNTGTHVGNLWTNGGALLATAVFTAESASGWQQVSLATPIAITANTTYVASYHTNAGHYGANTGYFASGVDAAPLHALRDGVDGPSGVYRYGSATAFPNDSYQSTNYWVDVVFTASLGGPSSSLSVVSVTPAAGATGVSATTSISASIGGFISYPSVNTTTFQLRDAAGNLVPATVLGGGESQTFPLIPTAPLAYGTAYTATVKGGPDGIKDSSGNGLASDYSWSFTTANAAPPPPPPVATCPCTLWNASTTTGGMDNDTSAVELGVRFRSDVGGYITGVRYYKYGSNIGTHVGNLWTNTGTRLATATFTSETASGWQQVTFTTPIAIAANTTYVASYHTDFGHYAASSGYFGAAFDNAPLHALANGADGSNGVYRYGTTAFPDQTYNAANYWVDVLFATSVTGDVTPPTVTSVSPASGAIGVATTATVNAVFSEPMTANTINSGTVELRDASGTLVPATIVYNITTPTAIIRPTSALIDGTTYTATVIGGTANFPVRDLAGNTLTSNYSWSFTVGTPSTPTFNCPCTIWSDGSTTATGPDADGSAVELGVRFRAEVSGFITGVRFYKYAANSGTHVGHLWSNSGALLATATFSGESTSGWQQVTFATPVAVTANTTYVASYHTSVGHYAASSGYFAAGVDKAPLHALKNGVDGPSGVYLYSAGSGGFPDQTYNATNYWVDVVFMQTAGGARPPPPPAPPPSPRLHRSPMRAASRRIPS